MKQFQNYIAIVCVILVLTAPTFAQTPAGQSPAPADSGRPHWFSSVSADVVRPYQARYYSPVNVSNTSRLDSLLRAGNLYLSLSDAIALSLENSLDVEIERYDYPMAQADLLRAQSGASILGVPTGVLGGVPNGAGLLLGSISSGLAAGSVLNSIGALGTGLSFDPIVTSNLNFGHTTTPQSNTITSGTSALVTTNKTYNFGYSQSFLSGGTVNLS